MLNYVAETSKKEWLLLAKQTILRIGNIFI